MKTAPSNKIAGARVLDRAHKATHRPSDIATTTTTTATEARVNYKPTSVPSTACFWCLVWFGVPHLYRARERESKRGFLEHKHTRPLSGRGGWATFCSFTPSSSVCQPDHNPRCKHKSGDTEAWSGLFERCKGKRPGAHCGREVCQIPIPHQHTTHPSPNYHTYRH